MNYLKRPGASIKRQPKKSFLVFVTIFVLGSSMSAAISLWLALSAAAGSVITHVPPLSILTPDHRATWDEMGGHFWSIGNRLPPPLSTDVIAKIANLSWVRSYDSHLSHALYGPGLDWVPIQLDTSRLPSNWPHEMSGLTQFWGDNMFHHTATFPILGVSNPDLIDVQLDLARIAEGRTFTSEDISEGNHVAVLPSLFAKRNELEVGDTITLSSVILDTVAMLEEGIRQDFYRYFGDERFQGHYKAYEFQVIGIIEILKEANYEIPNSELGMWFTEFSRMHNQIIVPFNIVENILREEFEAAKSHVEVNQQENERLGFNQHNGRDDLSGRRGWSIPQTFFVLYESNYLSLFSQEASELLPDFYLLTDFTQNYQNILSALEPLEELGMMILQGAIIGSGITLTLLVLLVLQDRRKEMGLYLALGEKKKKVMVQFIIEIVLISSVAIGLALWIGNILSTELSQEMFESAILERGHRDQYHDWVTFSALTSGRVAILNPGGLTTEQMFAFFDTSLNWNKTLTFIVSALGVILVSILLPILRIFTLNPKKILM
ncbi:MAG: ABC transporter permease [Turicibacter sp.]|nr:ABC transporter permease [Turicibacter sp.]